MSKFALIYENSIGKIEMYPKSDYQVMSISGLEQVATDSQVSKYTGIAGQKTLNRTPQQRNIIITGRISTVKAQRRLRTDNLSKIFDNTIEGVLRLNMWGKLRRINCYPDTVVFGELEYGKLPFVISLTCDNPYFKDWDDVELMLFSRVDNLVSGMTFPTGGRIFTYRYSRGMAINNGITNIEPTIIIEVTGSPTPGSEETGILIENETTGKQILIDYIPVNGEIITINIEDRKITSNVNGDITRYKPLEYALQDFVFKSGANTIGFTNYDTGQPLTAKAIYSTRYTEAMY